MNLYDMDSNELLSMGFSHRAQRHFLEDYALAKGLSVGLRLIEATTLRAVGRGSSVMPSMSEAKSDSEFIAGENAPAALTTSNDKSRSSISDANGLVSEQGGLRDSREIRDENVRPPLGE